MVIKISKIVFSLIIGTLITLFIATQAGGPDGFQFGYICPDNPLGTEKLSGWPFGFYRGTLLGGRYGGAITPLEGIDQYTFPECGGNFKTTMFLADLLFWSTVVYLGKSFWDKKKAQKTPNLSH